VSDSPSTLQIRLPLLFALTLAAGMFIGRQLPPPTAPVRFIPGSDAAAWSAFDEIVRYVQVRYVDTVNTEALQAKAMTYLLDQLDPHSTYISPEEIQAVQEDMSGGFEGVGIEFLIVDDTLQVVAPLAGGPSESAGILAGDKIVSINDTTIAGVKMDNGAIYKKLRGAKGTTAKLGILRGADKNLRFIEVIRNIIPVKSVDAACMLDEKTGYIKINRFTDRTYQEFMEGLQQLCEKQGMQHLVLDLRGNPGGYLNEATDLLSQLFPEGKLLVYTQGRTDPKREYKSNGRARFNIRNMAVLIDEGSASASEIVAGAIQDYDRGWIVGRRSYGKGLVQEQYPLTNGGGLRLTIARYFTPSGRCIQRAYANNSHYREEERERLERGELTGERLILPADTTRYYTGQGRVVYGGGGITPDVFVPLDTAWLHPYFTDLRKHLPQFAARWKEIHAEGQLPKTLADFTNYYKGLADMPEQLAQYAEKHGVSSNPAQLFRHRAEINRQIEARFAKLLFGDEAMYQVTNRSDSAVQKALQMMRSGMPMAQKR
jgi:carboxyl-terminal processing protease